MTIILFMIRIYDRCVSQLHFVANLLSHAEANPVQSTLLFFLLYSFRKYQSKPQLHILRSGLICFLCEHIQGSAITLAPSTTCLKSGGGVEVGVDPAGGQENC